MSLKQIVEFLQANDSLASINNHVLAAEANANTRIKMVKEFAKDHNVTVSIQENSTIAQAVQDATGIYEHPSYRSEFNAYTSRFTGWHMVFYSVRDSIGQNDYFSLINATINGEKGFIKCKKLSSTYMAWGQLEVKREYANGQVEYWLSPEFAEYIRLVLWVKKFFENR